MKIGFYFKLALTGITKNKKMYYPYILTCICMVMMFYIINFLAMSGEFREIPGGEAMQSMLGLGCGVIGFFALIFLYYTNSFLIRRRKKEFGLYHILGMGKRNLVKILVWENLITAVFSVAAGIIAGFLLSKGADVICVRIMGGQAGFSMHIDGKAVMMTVSLFAAIFFLIMVRMLFHIYRSRPVELLQSENVGEKPPKANWVLAILGAVTLGGAYYLALSIEEPMTALIWFFVAVIMVIAATYLLFIAGSVTFCRLLQKNKSYYYKTKHFVSLSSMVYRMKRNGSGLASICILSTMVLVVVSSTACLYIGAEDSLRDRYPRNIVLEIPSTDEAYVEPVREAAEEVLEKHEVQPEAVLDYEILDIGGLQKGDEIMLDSSKVDVGMELYENVRQLFIISLDDYNRITGEEKTLDSDEVIIYTTKFGENGNASEYDYDTITIEGGGTWKVKEVVPEFVSNGVDAQQIMSSLFLFVKDESVMEQINEGQAEIFGKNQSDIHTYWGFDLNCDDEEQKEISEEIVGELQGLYRADTTFPEVMVESVAYERAGFYGLFGGLFFLGILLGIIFVFGTVLIMYYKQISEGYEDEGRFDILRKVGMKQKEIRQSINSQVLTVFFLPLIAAGVHTAFAFPLISKLLVLFSVTDKKLLLGVTGACYLGFTLFYIIVYVVTSREYYTIVSGNRNL